jgi:hypothetical protein
MSYTAGAMTRSLVAPRWALPARLHLAIGFSALGLLIFLAVVFAARRLAGALIQPLSGSELVAAAAGIAVLAAVAKATIDRTLSSVLSTKYLVLSMIGVASAIGLAALTFADSSPLGVALGWFVLVSGEAVSWRFAWRARRQPRPNRQAHTRERLDLDEPTDAVPANVTQQLTRVREADRSEALHGLVRAEIAAGDRIAAVHLAFCPPLDGAPELTAHAIDADDAEVRITATHSYGTRLEVRLNAVAMEDRVVLVEVLGRTAVTSRSA